MSTPAPRLVVDGLPYELPIGVTSIGRADACDVVISSGVASRRHAELFRSGETVLICNLSGKNPARIDGEPITQQPLRDGDEIVIAGEVLRFEAAPLVLSEPLAEVQLAPQLTPVAATPTPYTPALTPAPPGLPTPASLAAVAAAARREQRELAILLACGAAALLALLALGGALTYVLVQRRAASRPPIARAPRAPIAEIEEAQPPRTERPPSRPFAGVPPISAAPISAPVSATPVAPPTPSSAGPSQPVASRLVLDRVNGLLLDVERQRADAPDDALRALEQAADRLKGEPATDVEVIALRARIDRLRPELKRASARKASGADALLAGQRELQRALATRQPSRITPLLAPLETLAMSKRQDPIAGDAARDALALVGNARRELTEIAAEARRQDQARAIVEVDAELRAVEQALARKDIEAAERSLREAERAMNAVRGLPAAAASAARLRQLTAEVNKPLVDDARVAKAVTAGQKALIRLQSPDGGWSMYSTTRGHAGSQDGPTALALLALVKSGLRPSHSSIRKGLRKLLRAGPPRKTYAAGLVCMLLHALAEARRGGKKSRKIRKGSSSAFERGVKLSDAEKSLLSKTARLLASSDRDGAWHYALDGQTSGSVEVNGRAQRRDRNFDHSNTQYAVLGLRAAGLCGLRFPRTWARVVKHFIASKSVEGIGRPLQINVQGSSAPAAAVAPAGWGYVRGRGTVNMTCAGIAAMVAAIEQLELCKQQLPADAGKTLAQGLEWVDRRARQDALMPVRASGPAQGYTLYGVERVGVLCGRRLLGGRDWYAEGAKWYLDNQRGDGSWTGQYRETVETAFALLFLKRGTTPTQVVITEIAKEQYKPAITGSD